MCAGINRHVVGDERARAAMLADVLAGESPAGGACPVGTVVISGGGKGDRPRRKPGSKSPRGLGAECLVRSARRASKSTGRSESEPSEAPKCIPHRKRMVGMSGVPSLSYAWRRPVSSVKELGTGSRRAPRGRRGRHVEKEQYSESTEPLAGRLGAPHSEGVAYKPQCGEIAMCLRVGRMGPIKR